MATQLTADELIRQLRPLATADQRAKYERFFQTQPGGYGEGDELLGVPMGQVFDLAKTFVAMPLPEVERLLESPLHEARVGAVSIMDFQARSKNMIDEQRRALYELYLRRHDRINNWDLVDRAAQFVVGRYLFDKPRDPLYKLARSANVWERRTAITSTAYFLRQGQVDDTFAVAELLLADDHDLIHKAAGGWLRDAGKQDPGRLLHFLDAHAAQMPRTMLSYAVEHLSPNQRAAYRAMK